ncbi:XrtA system polysaccharide chain length determinant [Hahella sp. HN01]|uniref:XrtA system polysaccharide chain length determinant n=1 Tax=Hahella sp. HN01 TaxID=2847262 RepID=UPI001C1F0D70|nr:XrtA system polysaccharide chain length determinant [Hahella sp. HN01]MBU6950590.1 hypothetical protein [Hahella sp. HN01]
MAVPLDQLPKEAFREIRSRKWLSFFVFLAVSFGTLVVGAFWPQQFTSRGVIYVDDQNIIRPLMEGSALTTKVKDHVASVEEVMLSRRVLTRLAEMEEIWGPVKTEAAKEGIISKIRNNVAVKKTGAPNFIEIEYKDSTAQRVFDVTRELSQLFIDETESSKREESRNAYEFVDKQVKAYQTQLQASEERLKNFLQENVDGTADTVGSRISSLERQLEEAELGIKEAIAQRDALQSQLSGQSKIVRREVAGDAYETRIEELNKKLDSLRLIYLDSYPDIIALKQQIAELERQRSEALSSGGGSSSRSESSFNPIYQELQSELSKALANIDTLRTRQSSLTALLERERTRMQRIQENEAKISELTRDYEVNKSIYDDLLKRREKARVSMRLDVEGHGLSYKIHEAPAYPLKPSGFTFRHFAMVGLFLGMLAPFGLAIAFCQVDPRVRTGSILQENTGIPVLATIPYISTPLERRIDRRRTKVILFLAVLSIGVYLLYGWMRYAGVVL